MHSNGFPHDKCNMFLNLLFTSSYTNSGRNNELDQYSHLLTVATRDLFGELDRNVRPVAPLQFLSVGSLNLLKFSRLIIILLELALFG